MMQIYEKFPRLASNNVSQRIKTYNTDRKVRIFASSKALNDIWIINLLLTILKIKKDDWTLSDT